MTQIFIIHASGNRQAVPLDGDRWIIGRDAACELCLEDSVTSRRHAQLSRDPQGQFWIQDLQSKNGTLVNDRPVTTCRIEPGDRIIIGGCELKLDGVARVASPSIVLSEAHSDTQAATNTWGREQRLQLAQKRLESLYDLNERLTGRFDRDDLLNEVLNICMESLRFERAGIAVWQGDPQPVQWVGIRQSASGGGGEIRLSRSIVDRALHQGERILITDTAQGGFDPTASMVSNNIRSAMCVPMEYHQKVRGVIYGDRVTSTGGYTQEDIDFFAALGRLGAMGLANVQLIEEMQQRKQIEMQLQWAREIQSRLFPAKALATDRLTIAALNDPGQKVSGDYYDYFVRPDGLVAIIIADVAGKGAPAALLMANLQAAVQVMLMEERDLVKAMDRLNKLVCRNVADSKFITGIFGLLDVEARRYSFVNAGHLGIYLINSAGAVTLVPPVGSLPLGVEENETYKVETVELGKDAVTMFLYTDGAPDAENPTGEHYGEERLKESLAGNGNEPPAELIARVRRLIKQFVRSYPQTDDITLVATRLEPQ